MLQLFAMITSTWFLANHEVEQRRRRHDVGVTTLEIVVIALGLLVLATAAVAVIKGAVDSRLNKIN